MSYRLHRESPVPIWIVGEGHCPEIGDPPVFGLYDKLHQTNGAAWMAFRGVPIDRLPNVLAHGVDVDPPDSTIFCDSDGIGKAWEYAESRGFMYALHGGHLERSFRVVPADSPPEVLAEIQKTYPYRYDETTRQQVYFTRLPNQVNLAYEQAYGYWVPGNAMEALLGVFVAEQYADALGDYA